jgi:hypothetical protein
MCFVPLMVGSMPLDTSLVTGRTQWVIVLLISSIIILNELISKICEEDIDAKFLFI